MEGESVMETGAQVYLPCTQRAMMISSTQDQDCVPCLVPTIRNTVSHGTEAMVTNPLKTPEKQ